MISFQADLSVCALWVAFIWLSSRNSRSFLPRFVRITDSVESVNTVSRLFNIFCKSIIPPAPNRMACMDESMVEEVIRPSSLFAKINLKSVFPSTLSDPAYRAVQLNRCAYNSTFNASFFEAEVISFQVCNPRIIITAKTTAGMEVQINSKRLLWEINVAFIPGFLT